MNETKVRGLKILLVDSDYDFLQVLIPFLSEEGFEVITALDGEEGLNKALVESPDLVILEPMLSKIHGFTLCAMITGEFKKNIPVIIVSKHYDDQNFKKEALRTHGASAYLVRPITKSELRAVIDDVLRSDQQELDEDKAVEREHPDLIPENDNEDAQVNTQEDPEIKKQDESLKNKENNQNINTEEPLVSEACLVETPHADRTAPSADKDNGAMKKIGAILNTEISFNKIRERLKVAVENEEISSVNYKERIIPGELHANFHSETKEAGSEATDNQKVKKGIDSNNNGKEPRKNIKVDEMLNDIMVEFGLSSTSTENRNKPSP